MRITRITKMRKYRVFRDFAWPADLHSFGQFNLIYGWNGSGKTAISSLFEQMERQSDVTDGEVEFELDDGTKAAGGRFSSSHLPSVRVFNRDFINATIQAVGTRVEPIYYLGEDSVERQSQVEMLKKDQESAKTDGAAAQRDQEATEKRLEKFCVDRAKVIRDLLIGSRSASYKNYNKADFKHAIQQLSAVDAETALLGDSDKERLRKQKDGQPKDAIGRIALTAPDLARIRSEVMTVLNRSIASQTLEELAKDPAVGTWVQRGLALHSGVHGTDRCRFCGQSLSAERRKVLESHFNNALAAFQEEIAAIRDVVLKHNERLSMLAFPDVARFYEHLVPDLSRAVGEVNELVTSSRICLRNLQEVLEEKQKAPFATTTLSEPDVGAPAPHAVETAIAVVNAIIDAHNRISADFQSQVDVACKKLEQCYVGESFSEYRQLCEMAKAAESASKLATEKVTLVRSRIDQIEAVIIEHRKPADELTQELKSYLGRDELLFELRGTGYALTRAGQPATHLSEGERTAISFLYFLKSLKDKSFDLATGVVVIDDPVSSLDANALFSAFGYMKERTRSCGQLFILTHNFAFFRQVKNWFHHLPGQRRGTIEQRPARCFALESAFSDDGRTAAIGPLDTMLEQHESEYHFLFKMVLEEAKRKPEDCCLSSLYHSPNVARRVLEAFLSFRFPQVPASELRLQLEEVEFDPCAKTRILRFLHTGSHHGHVAEPDHDPSVLLESRAVFGDLLRLIETVDPQHYKGMLDATMGAGK